VSAKGPYRKKAFRPERVAVASGSGERVDACFGKCPSFRIYSLENKDGAYFYSLTEERPGVPPCRDGEHDQGLLDKTAGLLSDCQMVLAGRIGPGAMKALSDRGIMGLPVALLVKDALARLAGD
jgi:predicted Fe-Mo cluster-binding NifX family protein